MKTIITGLLLIGSISSFASATSQIQKACLENAKNMSANLEQLQIGLDKACGAGGDEDDCTYEKNQIKRTINKGNTLDLFFADRDADINDAFYYSCDKNKVEIVTSSYGNDPIKFSSAKLSFDDKQDILVIEGNDAQYTIKIATTELDGKKVVLFGNGSQYGVKAVSLKIGGEKAPIYKDDVRLAFDTILFEAGTDLYGHNSKADPTDQIVDFAKLLSELSSL